MFYLHFDIFFNTLSSTRIKAVDVVPGTKSRGSFLARVSLKVLMQLHKLLFLLQNNNELHSLYT